MILPPTPIVGPELARLRTDAELRRCVSILRSRAKTTILDDPAQSLRAREAEAMCEHVWIFEARTLSTQPVRRRCGIVVA
jgi:hypothetical protein